MLGRKIVPPAPEPGPEWRAVEGKPHLEVNAAGHRRTKLPLPPAAPPQTGFEDTQPLGICP
jgi:hypothetical protein